MFHETFGFYAQGLTIEAAILPTGWKQRLVRYVSPATNGVVAWCLSLEDLFVSKALAGRPKDLEFCRSLIEDALVNVDEVVLLIETTQASPAKKDFAMELVRAG